MVKSIRTKLMIYIISLAIIPLFVVGLILATRIVVDQKKQGILLQKKTAVYVKSEFTGYMQLLENQLEFFVRLKQINSADKKERKNSLLELMSYYNELEELIITDSDGMEISRVHQYYIYTEDNYTDRSETGEFLVPYLQKEIYFSPVIFQTATGEPLMNISVPVIDQRTGKVTGVLIGSARLKKIWQLLKEMEVQESERIYILDSENKVIAHPNPSVVLRGTYLDVDLSDKTGIEKGIFNTRVVISHEPVVFGNQKFNVVVEQDAVSMFKLAVNSVLTIFVLMLVSLLLAVFLLFVILRNIIKPVQELVTVAGEIEKGDFTRKAAVFRDDEIGTLSRAFNRMIETVENTFSQLQIEIAEKKHSAEEIKKLQQMLSNIIDSMPSVIIAVDSECVVTHWNEEAEKFTGFKKSSVEGRALESEVPQFEMILSDIHESMSRNTMIKSEKMEFSILSVLHIMNVVVYPLRASGAVYGAVVRLDDITELVEREERLNQASKMESLGTLAGGMAHDFNNILQPIMGYSEMLAINFNEDPKTVKYVDQIKKAAVRASELVDRILTFSRKSNPDLVPVNIASVIKEVVSLLKSTLPATVEIILDIKNDAIMVMGNETQIHQVILNLAANALHSMSAEGGLIQIVIDEMEVDKNQSDAGPVPYGRYVMLQVSDNGTGMSPELTGRIFEPYFTTREKGKGTGLGLAVVKGIVESHRGSIEVGSTPGSGSTFTIFLPEAAAGSGPSESDPGSGDLHGTETVMLVDDEESIVRIEHIMLESLGYRTAVFTDSSEAYEAYRERPDRFDIVVTDLTMPRMTGTVLAARLHELNPHLPVIICTGYSEASDNTDFSAGRISGLIKKPVSKLMLASAIRKALDT